MDYKKYNDNELIYMVQENSEEYLSLLEKKYYPIIFKLSKEYYNKFIGCGYEFDDFYQEALEAFYRAIYSYDDSKNAILYTFVVVCIKRSLASFGRRIYRNISNDIIVGTVDLSDVENYVEDLSENPSKIESFKGLEIIIKDVLYSLSLEASSILELKINGFTYKEIGKLLDIPVSSVEFKSRRARNILRSKVRNYYCK